MKTSDHNLRHPHRAPTGLPRLLCTLSIIAALASSTLAGATRGLNRDLNVADAGLFQVVFTGPRGGGPEAVPANPYLFTGRRLDFDIREPSALSRQPSAGVGGRSGRPLLVLYDYRARAYDPWHGRFGQRDPALYAESLNLYQYALSNPLGRMDPTGEFSLGDLMGAVTTGARIYGWYATGQSIRQAIADFAAGVSLRNIMLDMAIGFAVDKAGGKMLDTLVDVAGPLLKKQAMQFGKGWRKGSAEIAELRAKAAARPMQTHHGVPNGGQKWSGKYEEILDQYDLSVLDEWNERLMPHVGRHPDEYNKWIYQQLRDAHDYAQGDQGKFLAYMKNILDLVQQHPEMLLKEYWRQ